MDVLIFWPLRRATVHVEHCDVFISHRGADTKRSLVGHITNRLKRANVDAFMDEFGLQVGDSAWKTMQVYAILCWICAKSSCHVRLQHATLHLKWSLRPAAADTQAKLRGARVVLVVLSPDYCRSWWCVMLPPPPPPPFPALALGTSYCCRACDRQYRHAPLAGAWRSCG